MQQPQFSNLISIFDIIGPVMIGPSSSHTAGAAGIGYKAFQELQKSNDSPKKIIISLYNSFSDTGKGHKTDLALLGGCLGMKPEEEKIIEAEKIAQQMGIEYEIVWNLHSEDYHPNTAIIEMKGEKKEVKIIGYSLGGGLTKTFYINDFTPYNPNSSPQQKTYFSLKNFEEILGKKENQNHEFLNEIMRIELEHAQKNKEYSYINTIISSSDQKITREQIFEEMLRRWRIMKKSIEDGVKVSTISEDGLFGGDAFKMSNNFPTIINETINNGIAFGLGVAEHNARMGKIVASPTAGSCGILPGTLKALQNKFNYTDEKIAEALFIAGAFGAITAKQVELAGAVAGCQAEIGVAGAMAGAAGAYLLNNNLKQMENSASLVLANLLGLTCDPIMGKVEVPCILRNAMVISMVFSAIELANMGVNYYISYDEIVTVMKEVGADMHEKYRETSTGGLATLKSICEGCGKRQQCFG